MGISPELIQKESAVLRNIAESRSVFLFASSFHKYENFEELKAGDVIGKKLNLPKKGLFVIHPPKEFIHFRKWDSLQIGKPSKLAGYLSFFSLQLACSAIHSNYNKGGLITLPLSKEWVIHSGVGKFTGHTEFLSEYFNKPTFMLMHGKKWNVIPLTTHVPLKKVPSKLKSVKWAKLFEAIESSGIWKSDLSSRPVTGFLGLNPHAGEGGKIGRDELDLHKKIIKKWKAKGWDIQGPLSADSCFVGDSPQYKLYLACYHDQGLIPFKILEGKYGINITLGLPFVRVSPDHGTAFDIAGKGVADSTSFRSCLGFFDERVAM